MTNISIAGPFYFRDYWGDHGFLLDNCIYVHVNGLYTATILSYEVQNSTWKKYTTKHSKSYKGIQAKMSTQSLFQNDCKQTK